MATSTSAATLISSTAELETFISGISSSNTLYLDLEGNNLSRHGTISLITILLHPQKVVKVIDVISLGESCFTTTSKDGKSLKSIFEDPQIPKCLWDVRNDADALWAHYHVGLSGVVDIQLLENASRPSERTYLYGLEKAIQSDLRLAAIDFYRWTSSKKEIRSLMSRNVFGVRPVEAKTLKYCANDVIYLPGLRAVYLKRIDRDWLAKAKEESSRRVEEAHSPTYQPQSATKALGPWGKGPIKTMTLDELCDALEDQRVEDLERDLFGDDDDYDDRYYDDDGPTSCTDIIDDWDYEYYYSD
ncbi:ribonuclease H-like domain-containing protein [Hypomontagnella submonticulosa]|nr:ribonuclease H-like domain-containing protein [Hypomontagnella submonticulosa]